MDNGIKLTNTQLPLLVYKEREGHNISYVRDLYDRNVIKGISVYTDDYENSLDFLNEYSFIEGLIIAGNTGDKECSFLQNMKNLRMLSLFSTGNKIVDVSSLMHLQSLNIIWRKGKVLGIYQCINLLEICIWGYKEANFRPIEALNNLKKLIIKTGSMKNLDGLEGCHSLETLSLAGCRYLMDISKLAEIPSLKSVHLDSCSQVHDFSILAKLPNLERLWIEDTRNIESIAFIRDMPQLKEFCIIGNCIITDDDLSPAMNTLSKITPRKSYNMEILPPDWSQRGGSSYGWWIRPIDLGDD